MKSIGRIMGLLASVGLGILFSPIAGAQTIFSEDFNSYSGNQNAAQGNTGLPVAWGGDVTGWSKSGAGVMHAVKLSASPDDWAIMFWQDNVITLSTGIAANEVDVDYVVEFDYGTADYAGGQGTGAGDSLLVEVLRADNSVLASDTFTPGAWGAGNYNLDGGLKGELIYTGDGSGAVRFRIGPDVLNQGRFAGEIDNLTVSSAAPPDAVTWSGLGTSGITATSAVATATVDTDLTETVLVWDTSDQGIVSTNDWTHRLSVGPTNAGPVSAEMTGLTSDTEYAWRFYGVSEASDGWSGAKTFVTQLGDAQTPLFTKAEARVGRIVLTWQDNAVHETGYLLQRSTDGAAGPYSPLATLPAGVVFYSDSSLSTGTYHYRLAATNAVNGSATLFADSQTNATETTAAIFLENFDSYIGTQNTTQADTGFPVAYGGSVAGWSNSGPGTMHAVNLNGIGNWAILFFQDNVITLTTGIDANDAGTGYEVSFDYGTAVYAAGNYAQRTMDGDGLLVEVLRADESVLASDTFFSGVWSESDSSNRNLSAGLIGTLSYVGDGSGVIRLRIGPALNSGRFEGEIDNVAVALSEPAPFPGTIIMVK